MVPVKSKLWVGFVAGLAASFGCKADSMNSGGFGTLGGSGAGFAGVGIGASGSAGLLGASGSTALGAAGTSATNSAGRTATAGSSAVAGSSAAGHGGTSPSLAGGGASGTSAGSAGAGMPPLGGMGDSSMCPAAPTGAPDASVQALKAVNDVRVPAGSGCINDVAALNMSALNHCNYYAMYTMGNMCISNVHYEVSSCAGYTGMDPCTREMAAGYKGFSCSEVMAFVDNPQSSVAQWINTVWHRIPILDPWTGDMGYGNATKCDTIDFGSGTAPSPKDTVVVYPYDGQTNLPTLFNGANEGPMPPAPSTGWPSSSPINVYAQGIAVTEHTLTVDGDTTPIDHVFLDSNSMVDSGVKGFLRNTVFIYANKPFMPNTKYHVKVVGTRTGGTLNLEWTFTTGAGNRF